MSRLLIWPDIQYFEQFEIIFGRIGIMTLLTSDSKEVEEYLRDYVKYLLQWFRILFLPSPNILQFNSNKISLGKLLEQDDSVWVRYHFTANCISSIYSLSFNFLKADSLLCASHYYYREQNKIKDKFALTAPSLLYLLQGNTSDPLRYLLMTEKWQWKQTASHFSLLPALL